MGLGRATWRRFLQSPEIFPIPLAAPCLQRQKGPSAQGHRPRRTRRQSENPFGLSATRSTLVITPAWSSERRGTDALCFLSTAPADAISALGLNTAPVHILPRSNRLIAEWLPWVNDPSGVSLDSFLGSGAPPAAEIFKFLVDATLNPPPDTSATTSSPEEIAQSWYQSASIHALRPATWRPFRRSPKTFRLLLWRPDTHAADCERRPRKSDTEGSSCDQEASLGLWRSSPRARLHGADPASRERHATHTLLCDARLLCRQRAGAQAAGFDGFAPRAPHCHVASLG